MPDGDFSFADAVGRPAALPPATLDTPAPQTFSFEEAIGKPPPATVDSNVPANPWVEAMWKDAPDSGELGPPSGAKEPPLPTGYTGDGRPYQSGWKWGLFNQDQPMDFVPDGTIKVPGQTRVQAAGNAAGAQLLQGFGQVAAAVPRLASNMQDPFKFHDLSPEDREKAEAWYNQRRQESTALANSIASAVADSNARNAPVDPKYTNDIAVNLAGGAGGLAPMVLGTMLGGVGGGAFVAGVQGYESTSENALAHGATPHDAHTAGMVGGLVSAGLMTVPAAQWLGGLTPAIRQPLVNAIVGTAVHSGSMVSIMQTQTLADNLIARNTYDPTRPITLGLGEHITDQALLGAFLPLATHSVPHLASHLFEPLPPTASERVQQNVLRTQEAAEPAFDAVDQQPNAQVPPTVTGPLADAITAQMRYAGLPPDVGVRLMNQVAGGGADGIYARGLVTMAMDTPPDQVPFKVQHETMHALLDPELGLLNDQDRQTLYRAANRWLDVTAPGENLPRRRLLAEQYGVHPLDPVVQEEGVARLSEAALLNGITTRSPIGAAAAKINNFVTSLGQGLRGQGFRTADDVFNGLMSGERAEPMTAGTAQYALPPRTRDTRPAPPAAPPPEPPPAAPPSEPPLATTEFTPLAEDPAALERELISGLPPIRPEMATTPEPQSDVEAQIAALRDPNNPKDTVFLAAGTPVPKAANAPGVLAYQRPEGTLLTTDVRKAREFADAHAVDDAFMARLLGYPETKSDVVAGGAPHVVQGRDEAGNVVVETLASPAGLPAAEAMVHEQAPVVEVTTPAAAQAERAEKTAAEAPVATPRPITADEMGARAAGVRAAPEPAAAPPSRAPRVVEPYVPVPKEPMRLINFLRTPTVLNKGTIHETTIPGGLQDTGNDIRSIIGGVRGRPGLLNAKGRTLDDATMHAWEAGYFPEHDQRPTINHLLDKIREDHTGNPQYSIHDQEAVEAYRDAMARNNEIGRLAAEHGIPTQGLTNAEFFDRLADRLSQDEMADEQARLADEHEAAYSEAERATQEWVAYHGTPHDFEQFDVGKIGTGEGAQAYGHGLYFAEAPGIAAGYRNKLTLRRPDFQKKAAELADVMRKANDAERQALDLPHDSPGFLAATRAAKEARDAYKAFAVSPGNLLTVRLRAKPEEMLDWDRPFSEQSPKVQDALSSLGLEPKADAYLDDESAYAGLGFPPRPKLSEEIPDSTGKEIYHAAEGKIGAPAEVSRMLHEAGIKGIRYLDASSRGAGDGTRNVVVFDHNDIEITHRNGIAVTPKNWNPDQFYGNDQARSLENLEHEHRQEEAALAAQQRAGGTEPPGPAGPHQGVVEEGARPVGGAAGVARRGEAEESTPAAESPPRGIEALPNLPIVKHMTKRGKVIEGVIRSDIDHAQAKALDPYTFKKNGGWFVRRDAAEAEAQGIPPPTVEAAASPRTAVQDVADAAHRDNFPAWQKARDEYHAGRMSDTDFLAAQAHHKSLVDAWDEADRAVRAAPKAKNTDLLGRPITETTKRGPEPTIRTDPNQAVMPGMEPSAVQAQAAADQKGRGAIGPTGEVKPANEGLFAPDTSGQGELQAPQAAASEAARPAAAPPVEHPGLVIHTRKPEWQPASAPSLSRPAAILAELNARNAPDIDYRAAFSTGAKTPLKPGETWKGRLEAWVASEASGKPGAERPETEQPKAEQAAPPPDEKPAGYGANNKTFTADVAAAARERLRAKLNRLNAGFDPEIMLDGLTLAGFHIEAGARSFADYTKAMLADLGDHVRPFLGHFYNSVRDYPGFDNHGMDNREAVERELQRPTRAEPPQRGDENDPLLANNIERWLQEGQPPDKLMANAVAAMLAEGDLRGAGKDRSLPVRRLQQSAEMIYGGKLGEGKFPRDRFYDAIEAGVNRYIANNPDRFSPTGTLARAQAVAESLREIKDRLPTQTVRAGDKDKLQQFSTPPDYSFAAAWIANMRPSDRVLEPSAGNGGLAVHAMNAGAAEVIGNEISPQRRAMMQNLPFSRITGENAEQLHNILPVDVRPSVVIMNPPFSSAGDRLGGKMDVKIGAQHIDQALARLEPGGRLVAIVGRGMGMNAPTFRDWWKRIGTQYDVRANVAVDGSIYRKYGTTFGTRVLVIDKIAPTGRPIVEGEAKDAADLLNTLAGVHDDRPGSSSEPVGGQPTGAGLAEEGPGRPNGPEGGLPNPTGAVGPDGGRGVGEVTGRPVAADESGPGSAGRAPDTGNRAGEGGGGDGVPPVEPRHEPAGEPVAADANDTGRREPGGGIAAGGGDHLRPDGSDQRLTPPNPELVKSGVIVEDPVQGGELTESVYEPYRPQRLAIEGAREHPGALVQSTAMASVSPPMPRHALAIPRRLIDGGALSIAQLEAVVYAGDAHAQILPAAPEATVKYRRGFFVGDGTGVGKGREVAGIILDNWMSGRRRAVWVSETPALVNDAKRDWAGLGMDPSHILPLTKVKAADAIKHDGILFASYDTLKSGVKIKPLDAAGIKVGTQVSVPARDGTRENGTVTGRYKDGWVVQTDAGVVRNYDAKDLAARTATAKTRVQQIVDWLGKDFDGVIAFDESHNLGNSISQKGARGSTDPAQKALAGIELQKQLPNARVVYVSATGATEVSNLAYADRLGLWGRGTAFSDRSDFLSKISQGGVAAMELVARDMKALGHYMARNLSYDGVEYDRIQHDLTPDQTVMYDKISEAWQVVLRNFNKALEDTNAGGKGGRRSAILSAFWGAHQRFFNQLITSLQMPSVLRAVERDVAEGRQAVLQLVNTNEAGQNRAIDKARADPEGDIEELDMSPRDQLMALVEKAFPVEQFETYVDDAGKERVRPVVDSEGKPVLNREAVAAREKLLDDLGSLRVPDGPLEILTSHFGPDKVAEVTGRTQRVVRKPDESGQVRAVIEKRNAETNVVEANAFQNGVKRILVFSQAGGTGRSYHADLSSPSADNRRSHYLVQPGWRADKAVQGFGRTHRTNQASAPIFHLVTTNLEGQKRFISSIARRLGQLGALTKGERRTGDQGMFGLQDNLESDEAHAALQQFYRDVHRGQIEGVSDQSIQETMGLQLIDPSTGGLRADLPPMSQFLNRILSLPVGEQNRVFNAFSDRFRDVIDHAVESGTLDAGTETYRADKIVKNTETTVYTDPTSGAVTKHVALHAFSKNYPTPFEELHDGKSGRASYQAPSFYVRSRRDGQIFAVVPTTYSRTGADGITTEFYRMVTPTNWRYIEKDRMDRALSGTTRNAPTADRVTDLAEARKGWDERVAATPEFKRSDLHLITGAVLPIWDRLQGNPKIFRLQTDQGERLLGRVIANNDIGTTLTNLGAEAARVDFRPNEVAAKVLDGATATLANGWTLKRSMVAGEWRIELKGPSFADYGPLRQDGVFQERIGYDTRLFVPTGDRAAEVLGRITERRPVTAVDSGGQPAQTMFSLRQRRKTPQSNTSLDAEAMSAAVKLATYHVEAGARSFTEFSRAMVADIGDAIRPHLQQLYSEAHDTIQQEIDRYLNEPVDRTQAQRPAGNVPTLLDQGPPKPRPSVGHNGGPPVDLGLHGAPERGETVRPPQEDPGGLFSPPPGPPRAPVPPEVEAARITAPAKIKNLNFAENYAIFPRTLASLDAMSARLWNAWKARDYEAANNVTTLRHEIAGDFLKLNKSDRLGVAAALEIGRIAPEGLYRDDNGRIVVRNDTVPFARWSKVGDVLRLSDAQTRAADEAISLGGKQWDMLMQGAAHRFGWEGTLDPKAIREAAARVDEKAGAKRLGRLADLLDAMQAQRKNIYFPMQRFGSHYISVRPKEGPDVAAGLGGKPPLAWFETIEKPGLQDFLGTTYGRFSVEAKAAQRIAELRRQFPADRFDITQGNFVRDPEILRKLDLPALQKLMMMMENKVEAGVRKQVMAEEGGPKTPTGVREEASARYESMYGKTIEAFYDALFEELKAGYRKHASVVPGYSGDFDRAISSHMHQIANNAANMVHRDGIESAYQDIQDRHPHENVKRYWRDWRAYQEDPKSLLGRAADTLNQVGFTWVMGMNPSSTIIMATHTPLAATPVLSVGVGAGPASAAIGRGLRAAYGALRFDKMVGGHIDLEKAMAGMPPEKQAFLRKMANEGRLEAVGADDLARLNERQSQLFGEHAGLMRRAMDIATSNVRAVDQANRFGVASAAWDIGNDPAKLNAAAAPLMRHNALFSDMVRNSGLSAETYGRFMLSEAAFEWGKQNRMPITRGPLGTLAGSLHGFQTRYLSTALRLSKNMGPEGKIAAAFMMGALALGAGMAGLPFAQDTGNAADAVWRHFGGYNPEIGAKLEDMLGSAIGKVGAQIVLHGAPSVFPGIDLGGRIGFGDVVSRMMDPANVMGTMPAIMWKSWENAKARWDNGQGLSAAAAEAVPFALRGPLRALNESERGIVSRSGLQLMPPSALSTGDLIRTGFGFTPESVAEMYRERQRYYEAQQAQPSLVAKIKSGDPSWMQDAQRMGWSIGRIRSFQRSVVRGPTDMQFQRYEQNAHPNQW